MSERHGVLLSSPSLLVCDHSRWLQRQNKAQPLIVESEIQGSRSTAGLFVRSSILNY